MNEQRKENELEQQKKQQKKLNDQQDKIKKIKKKNAAFAVLNSVFAVTFAAVCLFSVYRRYDELIIFDKPIEWDDSQTKFDDDSLNRKTTDLDENQQGYTEPSNQDEKHTSPPKTTAPKTTTTSKADDSKGHFTIYSVGDVFKADTGSGKLSCDVRNTADSTHDIVMSLYISEEELKKHNLSTKDVKDGKWLIAQTGLFQPGYQITSVQLLKLPDNTFLPAGTYSLTMNEKYYHHVTGSLSSYEANIPVTLEVAQ